MGLRTPLYDCHLQAGAKMVDFGGWDMPIQYASLIEEHHAVRRAAGMFDVSHMTFLELTGAEVQPFLRQLLANDVARLNLPGKALYSALLKADAGILDDLIVYAPTAGEPELWRVIVNCATHDKDIAWIVQQAEGRDVTVRERTDLAMLAIQGPEARSRVASLLGGGKAGVIQGLKVFQGEAIDGWFIARTGYTGEDGLEILLPADVAPTFWNALLGAGIAPCGLGARDTLRLEAGMNLYGIDMGESNDPLESNMAWTIAWEPAERDFIGRQALDAKRAAGEGCELVGLVLEGRGVLRSHLPVRLTDGRTGETTSGTFSPTLGVAIALARLPATTDTQVEVEIRGKWHAARIVKPPFVRNGKSLI